MASLTVTVLNGAPTDCGTAVNCIAKPVHISLRKRSFRAQYTVAVKHSRRNTEINVFTVPAPQHKYCISLGTLQSATVPQASQAKTGEHTLLHMCCMLDFQSQAPQSRKDNASHYHLHIAWQIDGELRGAEDMLGLGPLRQNVAGSHSPDEGALARLTHAKVASIQHTKAHLQTTTACL